MKVSEAIDQLQVGDTVWVKGEVACINKSGVLPLCIKFAERTKVFVEADEISLTEPTKKVEIPECVGEWIEFCKEQGFSLHTAMNEKRLVDGAYVLSAIYQNFRDWLTDENYQEHEEIFARAWVNGYTVKPKRWVVKQGGSEVWYLQGFRNSLDGDIVKQWCSHEGCIKFTDKSKAEAVALLVEGSVEEV